MGLSFCFYYFFPAQIFTFLVKKFESVLNKQVITRQTGEKVGFQLASKYQKGDKYRGVGKFWPVKLGFLGNFFY